MRCYWWKREILTYQAVRDLLRNAGFTTWVTYYERYLEAIYVRGERLIHNIDRGLRFLVRPYGVGVSVSYT